VPQNYAEALKWYRKVADQGDAIAQIDVGLMYDKGQGVPQDYVQAHTRFNLSAGRSPRGDVHDAAVQERDTVATKMTPARPRAGV
jgi:TPR repeat protein